MITLVARSSWSIDTPKCFYLEHGGLMRRWMGWGRGRRAALIAVTGLLLGAATAVPALRSAWAADASTKYLGIFREATPTSIASGTVSRYGVTPASVMWFDSWATGNAFNVSEARALVSQ